MRTKDYEESLAEVLKDPEEASAYLDEKYKKRKHVLPFLVLISSRRFCVPISFLLKCMANLIQQFFR